MTNRVKRGIRHRNKIWKQYTQYPSYDKKIAYTKKRNEVGGEIRKAKQNFEYKLAENIKEDPKSFYAYVRSTSKAKLGIGPLKDSEGKMVDDAIGMGKILNNNILLQFLPVRTCVQYHS